jgi:hypothetical protein
MTSFSKEASFRPEGATDLVTPVETSDRKHSQGLADAMH